MKPKYRFKSAIWQYGGEAPWFFVSLPKAYTAEIKYLTNGVPNKGFGTVKVTAVIDRAVWDTAIFPDTNSGTYMMPIKKEVRSKLRLEAGKMVEVEVIIKDV